MSGSAALLVPSASRIVRLDTRPGIGPATWPNKNADDVLDHWIDCSGLLRDLGGAAVVSIGAVAIELVAGDASLVQVGALIKQGGMIMVVLGNGTPSTPAQPSLYQLFVTVQIQGGPVIRTYTKVINLTMSTQPAFGSPLVGVRAQLLLDGADISAAFITTNSTGPSDPAVQLTAGAWVTDIAGGGGSDGSALVAAQAAQAGQSTFAEVSASGTDAASTLRLVEAETLIIGGSGGVGLTATPGVRQRAINISGIPQPFYPSLGLHWRGMAIDVPLMIPDQAESTGIQFASGTCIAG